MATKLASEVRKGDLLVFVASNGRTLARVTGTMMAEHPTGVPIIGLHITLTRAVALPDLGWRTNYWTLWHRPHDPLELYDRSETRRVR